MIQESESCARYGHEKVMHRPQCKAYTCKRDGKCEKFVAESLTENNPNENLKSWSHIQSGRSRESGWVAIWLFLLFLASVFVIMMLAKHYPLWPMRYPVKW